MKIILNYLGSIALLAAGFAALDGSFNRAIFFVISGIFFTRAYFKLVILEIKNKK